MSPARLAGDRRGVSVLEFALIAPLVLVLGLWGTELAWLGIVDLRVSEVASALADNASRLGQSDNSAVTPTVSESGIDAIMAGALAQAGTIDLAGHGRLILSSLERDPASGRQFIHWQRCRGELPGRSRHGGEGSGLPGYAASDELPAGESIAAPAGGAVMIAEVAYAYPGLFGRMFVKDLVLRSEAAFIVRDDRNLLQSSDGTLTAGVTGGDGRSGCEPG